MMTTKSPGTRSLFVVLAISAITGFAALALLGASRSAVGRAGGDLCLETLAAYEEAVDQAEQSSVGRSNPEVLAALRQKAYADYADCVSRAGVSGAASLERTPPPTFARPPFTPPGRRGTPPPVEPPRGTPVFVPPGPPMTPPGRMMTPPGPPFTPPPTRGRPPLTPPGPPITPPGHMVTPPGPTMTPPGPPITPAGRG